MHRRPDLTGRMPAMHAPRAVPDHPRTLREAAWKFRKATFLNRQYRKVAFLNFRARPVTPAAARG
jgi:hypothetical protein